MLRWITDIFTSKTPKPGASRSKSSNLSRLEELLRTPGRAHQEELISLAHSLYEEDFVAMVHCPSLVGSAIQHGELTNSAERTRDVLSSGTFTFSPAEVQAFLEGRAIEQTIFLLRKEHGRVKSGHPERFSIGRAKSNDIRIVDFAISRNHAIIDVEPRGCTINDCGSRNGTKVNGRAVGKTPTPLNDKDIISLGRYQFAFLLPKTLYERLQKVDLPATTGGRPRK